MVCTIRLPGLTAMLLYCSSWTGTCCLLDAPIKDLSVSASN